MSESAFERAAVLRVEPLGPGRFRVSGGRQPHLVELDGGTPRCDCDDFAYRGRQRPCKHIRRALAETDPHHGT